MVQRESKEKSLRVMSALTYETDDVVECQPCPDANITAVYRSCARGSYAPILKRYTQKLVAMQIKTKPHENTITDLRDQNARLTQLLEELSFLLKQRGGAGEATTLPVDTTFTCLPLIIIVIQFFGRHW